MEEEYLQEFGQRLARLINPGLPMPTVQQLILQTIRQLRASGSLPSANRRLHDSGPPGTMMGHEIEIVFVHDCRNHGCNVPHCVLCKHNPNKRCTGNFAGKYWVGDRLLAKCEGEIQVELIDASTGDRVVEDLSSYRLEVCILDGNRYNKRCREAGEQRLEILDDCEVLLNQKQEPLLQSANANNTKNDPRVLLKFQPGTATVPLREVKVTESSESVLAGTKRPPFRLVVRAVHESGSRLQIRPAVSEEFVVVTKRTKNLKKQDIPSLDDPIAKLNHVGKETVKKLNELKASADEIQMDLHLPPNLGRITKVKEFLKLVNFSEADGHLQQKLKQLLKLSKEKWEAACEHAKTAVQMDNRMRAWYKQNMSVGLLYTCSMGGVRPDRPVALIQNRKRDGSDFMEVIPMEHQLPAQRAEVQGTCEYAIRCWWEDSHPGWMIFTLGNQHFETLDEIIKYSRGGERPEGLLDEADVSALVPPPQPNSDDERNVADSVSSGRTDQQVDPARPSYRQPNSKQSETQQGPKNPREPVSPTTSPPTTIVTSQNMPDRTHSPPPETQPLRQEPTRGNTRSLHSLIGMQSGHDQPHQPQGGEFTNPFENNLSSDLYRREMPAQSQQAAYRDVPGSRGGFALDNPGTGLSNNPLWQQDGGFAASGSYNAANLPFMFSLDTLMKMGSLPSLRLNESGFPSIMPQRPFNGEPHNMQAFTAANFGHPGFMDHPGDMGRGLQAAGNPGLKRKMIEQGGEPFPDKQARLSMADPPGAGHD